MHVVKGSRNLLKFELKNPVLTLGNFDGVHLGHQKILKKAIQRAKAINGVSVVYTFNPHPMKVIKPEYEPKKITTFDEKAQFIEELGIDYLIVENFTQKFSERSPEEFIKKIICARIHPCEIVIGHDYAFGKGRKGAVDFLTSTGHELNYEVDIIRDITIKNIPVRSTTIRNLIASGKVSLAEKLIGRPYSLSGKVVHGKQRKIGFPTANLSPRKKDLIPERGIYAIRIGTPYGQFNGTLNIGLNPTFDGKKLTIEAHIFDFNRDLYGKKVTLFFIKRIRDEKKFKDGKTLAEQIEKDIKTSKKILDKK